ncbi:MAG: hypothetical protein AB1700_18795, partial [Bacillota bacterium]
ELPRLAGGPARQAHGAPRRDVRLAALPRSRVWGFVDILMPGPMRPPGQDGDAPKVLTDMAIPDGYE